MSLTRAELPSDGTNLEGLEPFFETVTATITETDTKTDTDAVTVTTAPAGWTLREAADQLGISPNTIRNRIKTRELHGFKVQGPNGPEWRITPPTDAIPSTPPTSEGLQALLQVLDSQSRQIDSLTKQLDTNAFQLKAAADVVTYLHDQLREKDTAIKLLTDRHRSWWHRFASWALRK